MGQQSIPQQRQRPTLTLKHLEQHHPCKSAQSRSDPSPPDPGTRSHPAVTSRGDHGPSQD